MRIEVGEQRVLAVRCQDCDYRADLDSVEGVCTPREEGRAKQAAAHHARSTGHMVAVEHAITTAYRPRAASRAGPAAGHPEGDHA